MPSLTQTAHDGPRPGRLMSSWDIMQHFDVSGFFSVVRLLGIWSTPGDEKTVIASEKRKGNIDALEGYSAILSNLGVSGAKISLERLIAALKKEDCTYGDLIKLSEEINGRLIDETSGRAFFALTPREVDIHRHPRKGWEKAIERFPLIVDDVEEASKCFALSRYPAAIFHSLQIVEAALIELGIFLKVKDPTSGWTAVSGALAKVMKKERKDLSRFEKRNRAFLEQVHGTVEGLKNAWRNKISHIDGRLILITKDFSPEIAEEILFATRAFVRRLAEGLPTTKLKKSGAEAI